MKNEETDNGLKTVYNNTRHEIFMEFRHVQSLQTEKYKTLLREFKSQNTRYDIPCFRVKLVKNGFPKDENRKHYEKLEYVTHLKI